MKAVFPTLDQGGGTELGCGGDSFLHQVVKSLGKGMYHPYQNGFSAGHLGGSVG